MQKTIKSMLALALLAPTLGFADSYTLTEMGDYDVLNDVTSGSEVALSGAVVGPGVNIYGSAILEVGFDDTCLVKCDEDTASDDSVTRSIPSAYYGNGPGELDPTGRSLVMGVQDMGYGVNFQRKVYIPEDSAFVRWINKIENTNDEEITAYLIVNGLLETFSEVIATSSGDGYADQTDDWILTGSFGEPIEPPEEPPAPNTLVPTEPFFTAHILNGSGDGPDLEYIDFLGDGGPTLRGPSNDAFWVYEVNVPAGETVVVMHFLADVTALEAELGEGVLEYLEDLAEGDVPNALDFMTNQEFSELFSAYDATIILDSSGSSGTCFIATAAFGTPMAEEINTLRQVRDSYMLNNALGTTFVDTYYRLSPPIASKVAQYPALASVVRAVLMPIVLIAKVILAAPMMVLTSLLVMMGLLLARRKKGLVS